MLSALRCAHEERGHGRRGRTEKAERERPFSTGSNSANGLFQRILVELTGFFLTDFSRANGWRGRERHFQRALVQLTDFSAGFNAANGLLQRALVQLTGFFNGL